MVIYNLEYSILDKLGRAKSKHHVGVFKTIEEVEKAKVDLQSTKTEHQLSFQVYIIDNIFTKIL